MARSILTMASTVALALGVSACSPGVDTMRVDNRASNLEGQNSDAVLQCMGEPQSIQTLGGSEIWRYTHERVVEHDAYDLYGGTPGVIIRMPASTQQGTCIADVTVIDDVVQSISFSGDSGGGLNRRWACMPLMENCQ